LTHTAPSKKTARIVGFLYLLTVPAALFELMYVPAKLLVKDNAAETAANFIWLLAFALPLWRAGQIDSATASTIRDCTVGILLPVVMPWGYVWRTYLKQKGDRWK
jgi:hypothetical protein